MDLNLLTPDDFDYVLEYNSSEQRASVQITAHLPGGTKVWSIIHYDTFRQEGRGAQLKCNEITAKVMNNLLTELLEVELKDDTRKPRRTKKRSSGSIITIAAPAS